MVPPEVIAAEIVEDLQAALDEFQAVAGPPWLPVQLSVKGHRNLLRPGDHRIKSGHRPDTIGAARASEIDSGNGSDKS